MRDLLDVLGGVLLFIIVVGCGIWAYVSIGDYFTDRYFDRHPDRWRTR